MGSEMCIRDRVMYVNGELNDEYQNSVIHNNDIIEIHYRDKSD